MDYQQNQQMWRDALTILPSVSHSQIGGDHSEGVLLCINWNGRRQGRVETLSFNTLLETDWRTERLNLDSSKPVAAAFRLRRTNIRLELDQDIWPVNHHSGDNTNEYMSAWVLVGKSFKLTSENI